MKNNTPLLLCTIALISLPLQGCSNVKDSLGLEKESPDEFSVLSRAPLEMPPSLALPPPNAGAPRPQEKQAITQAAQALLGQENTNQGAQSAIEKSLLNNANAQNADQNIRKTVNKETAELHNRNRAVADKLLNLTGGNDKPSATIVNAKEELERLRKNKEEGKPVTAGQTPIIED